MVDAAVSAPASTSVADDSGWWVPLVMGIVSVMFGLLLFTHPAETSIWIAWMIGVYWFIGGVVNLVMMFVDRTQWGWKLVLGILGILAGMVVLDAMGSTPLIGAIGLATVYVWVLGIQGMVYGVIQIIQAFQGGGWGIGILGLISTIFGALLFSNAFVASFALPWVFGVFAVAGGISAIILSFRLKNA